MNYQLMTRVLLIALAFASLHSLADERWVHTVGGISVQIPSRIPLDPDSLSWNGASDDNDSAEGVGDLVGLRENEEVFRFSGNISHGKFEGYGRLINTVTGEEYVGQWRNSELTGFGKHIDMNGFSYIGGWDNGRRDGKGMITTGGGSIISGKFINGSLQHIVYVNISDRDIENFSQLPEGTQDYMRKSLTIYAMTSLGDAKQALEEGKMIVYGEKRTRCSAAILLLSRIQEEEMSKVLASELSNLEGLENSTAPNVD